MQSISECFEEHHKRWSKISQLCGLSLSPLSKSPPNSSELSLHDVTHTHIRYHQQQQRTSFVHHHSMSELVHPSLYQRRHHHHHHHHHPHHPPAPQTHPNPPTRNLSMQGALSHVLPAQGKSSTLPGTGVPPRHPFLEKKRHTLTIIPDSVLTDSLGSTSSSCSTTSQPTSAPPTGPGPSSRGEGLEEGARERIPKPPDVKSGRGSSSREGSVDVLGRGVTPEGVLEQKKATQPPGTDALDGGRGLSVKARSSPRAPRPVRNRGKPTTLTSDV